MLRTLWNYPYYAVFLALAGILTISLPGRALSDSSPTSWLPDESIHTMSNDELLETALALSDADDMPGVYETRQNEMNVMWLEAGMKESADYQDGSRAMRKIASTALKYYWSSLVEEDPSYDRYTAVVTGNYSSESNGIDYGLHFSLDSVKLQMEYSF